MARTAAELQKAARDGIAEHARMKPISEPKYVGREPTEAMVEAASTVPPTVTINEESFFVRVWRAMWDAAE